MILSACWRVFQGWGRSSAGRAPALQAGGHRFDPDRLHQRRLHSKRRSLAKYWSVSRMIEFGLIMRLGKESRVVWSCRFAARLGGAVLCYIVNQVLVRLWARVIGIS